MKDEKELERINKEIEESLIKELEEGREIPEKKGYHTIRFWIMVFFICFMIYRVSKAFFQ